MNLPSQTQTSFLGAGRIAATSKAVQKFIFSTSMLL